MKQKSEVEKFLNNIKKKFDHFYGEDTAKIIDNNFEMHMIIRTKHSLNIPSREDSEHRYYFLRDILDKSDQIFINVNHEGLLETWFVFNNLDFKCQENTKKLLDNLENDLKNKSFHHTCIHNNHVCVINDRTNNELSRKLEE